jgi:hypothetical protein
VLGEESSDRDHLAMGCRVFLLLAEIAPAGEHLAVTHDDRAEGIIAKRGFLDGHTHEARVRFRRGRLDASGECARGDRQRQSADGPCDQMAPAHTGGKPRQVSLHVVPLQLTPARRNVMTHPRRPLLRSRPSLIVQ